MNVQELKELLQVNSNAEVAAKLDVGASAVSNWVAKGEVPSKMQIKAQRLVHSLAGLNGHGNTIHIGGELNLPPELTIIRDCFNRWTEKKRKKLLRSALEIDELED